MSQTALLIIPMLFLLMVLISVGQDPGNYPWLLPLQLPNPVYSTSYLCPEFITLSVSSVTIIPNYYVIDCTCLTGLLTSKCNSNSYITLQLPIMFSKCYSDVSQFSRSVKSNSLQPHGLQHARLPCVSDVTSSILLPTKCNASSIIWFLIPHSLLLLT